MLNPSFSGPETLAFAMHGSLWEGVGEEGGGSWTPLLTRGFRAAARVHGEKPAPAACPVCPGSMSSSTSVSPVWLGTVMAGTVLAGSGLRARAPRAIRARPCAGR